MNIFILDDDVCENVKSYCDKHIVKMVLETAQILCAAHTSENTPYKKTHINHPCVKWTKESINNYYWLCELGVKLCAEYQYRYEKVHKSLEVLEWCLDNEPDLPDINKTQHVVCVSDSLKHLIQDNMCISDVVEIYRLYYQEKADNGMQMKYTKRNIPEWLH